MRAPVSVPRAARPGPSLRGGLAVVSVAAAAIHAAVAVAPGHDAAVVAAFAAAAAVQAGWAVLVLAGGGRRVLAGGAALHAGFLAVAALTWLGTPGLAWLHHGVGLAGAVTVGFEAVLAAGALAATRPVAAARRLAAPRAGAAALASGTLVLLLVGLPALADALRHGHAEAHTPSAAAAAGHDAHASRAVAGGEAGGAGDEHVHDGPAGSTADERVGAEAAPATAPSAAAELVEATRLVAPRWADVATAEADGFRSIGDGLTGYEHYVHWEWAVDGRVLDADRPESLVYRLTDVGHELVSAMYILPEGATMADAPDLGDPRAEFHVHDDLCWGPERRVAGLYVDGRCVPGGVHAVTPPMLHVWLVDHPCGPFAGIDGPSHRCEHRHP